MKRLGLILVVLSLTALGDAPPRYRVRIDARPSRCVVRPMDPGCPRGAVSRAFFEFAPVDGTGLTSACTTTAPTGTKGEALIFTRASSAWCTKDDYSLVLLSNNQPRVMSGTGGTSPLGLLVESAGQNDVLNNRDLSAASWTKTSMTCAKTATGADNVANSASTCTASGASGTVLQSLTIAAATRNSSLYIKRRTGTGTIEVTRNNGSTWTDITSGVTNAFFKRVVSAEAVGCAYGGCIVVPAMTSGIANPTVGIRLGTSGDAVDVDLVQDEVSSTPRSPITTAGTAGTRGAEDAYFAVNTSINAISASVVTAGLPAGYNSAIEARSVSAFLGLYLGQGSVDLVPDCYLSSGSATEVGSEGPSAPLGPVPVRCSFSGTALVTTALGFDTSGASSSSVFTATAINIGNGIGRVNGVVSQACADPNPNACRSSRAHPTTISWVGDSISYGVTDSTHPPTVLRSNLVNRTVVNSAWAGSQMPACVSRLQGAIASRAGTVVFFCGINSINAGVTGAATWALAEPTLTAAKAQGMKVIVVTYDAWGSQNAVQVPAYNAAASAWCVSSGATCVSTASLGTGNPSTLAPAYNSGDNLHPNGAGSTLLAGLVQAANP